MFLRQSTSQTVRFGPFLDSTDGVTAETGLTISQADMQLSKDGGAFAQKNASGDATHDTSGWYSTTLNTTDTNTVGELILEVAETGALPVWHRWWVIEENIYDAIYGASAAGFDSNQRVDLGSWLGNAVTASSGNPDVNVESIDDIDAPATWQASINSQVDTAISDAALATAANLATVDTNVDAILVDTGTTLPASIATIDTNVDAVLVDTGTTLPATLTTIEGKIDTVDTNVDAVLVDTGTTIPNQITALNNVSVSDILTTQMTESYAPDGTAPTLAQALFLIMQQAGEFAISGTTITVKQLDGTTTAATFTLDDGTNPTSRTRAT